MSSFQDYPRISPFLWFDSNAEEAVNFYLTVFRNSRLLEATGKTAEGAPLTLAFELDGQKLTALNGGPPFRFSEAISLVVRCDSQDEVDYYWSRLLEGGTESQCGWLKDKFGLSWQIVPSCLPDLIKNPKAMQAMTRMIKLDIAELERAARE